MSAGWLGGLLGGAIGSGLSGAGGSQQSQLNQQQGISNQVGQTVQYAPTKEWLQEQLEKITWNEYIENCEQTIIDSKEKK